MAGKRIVCRCNDVTAEEIEALIDSGVTDIEEIKRLLRVGMGGPARGGPVSPPSSSEYSPERQGKGWRRYRYPKRGFPSGRFAWRP